MENLQLALMLMLVGLLTVFSILLLIILLGKCIIWFVNKYFPEKEIIKTIQSATSNVELVISEAIKKITNGRGSIEKIEKL